jgi:hypothetical protein
VIDKKKEKWRDMIGKTSSLRVCKGVWKHAEGVRPRSRNAIVRTGACENVWLQHGMRTLLDSMLMRMHKDRMHARICGVLESV